MYTYLAKDYKYYKIGKSNNPANRIKSMQTANPMLELLCWTDKLDESYLHRLFAHKRVKGEYFYFDASEIKYVILIFKGQLPLDHKWYIKTRGRAQKFFYNKVERTKYENYKMPFGKYKGKKLVDVDNEYLKWLYNTNSLEGKIKEYIFKKLNVRSINNAPKNIKKVK